MKKVLTYSLIVILAMVTVVCGCLFVGCDTGSSIYGDYTLKGFSYSVTDVGEGYIDINNMSETDHSTYDMVILMYGKRVSISKNTIKFVDGMILSGYGDTKYTLNGEEITFSDSAIASTFNYVTLSNGIFSIGVSQTVNGITVKYSFEYYSEKATVPTYTIYFDSNGGTDVAEQSVKKGEKVKIPLFYPRKTGYAFDGWYKDYECTEAYDFSAQVLRGFWLYAKWEPLPNKVTFNSNGGTHVKEQTVISGNLIIEPDSPKKAGYTFGGWYSDSGLTNQWDFSTPVAGDITLYAKFTPNTYTISFNAQKGTCATSTKEVTYSSTVGELPTPVREGFVFDGWYDHENGGKAYRSTTVYTTAENITLYAKWLVKITLDAGSNGSVNKTEINGAYKWKQSDVESLPVATTAKDWNFAGWYTEPMGYGVKYDKDSICQFEGTTTLYAAWSVTINYDANGGDAVPSSQAIIGNRFVPATPVRIGYTFTGWHDADGNTVNETTVINYDKTTVLTASWTANQITFKFDVQGGNSVSDRQYTYDLPFGEFPIPERANYVFGGWFTLPAGNGKQYDATDVCKDDSTVTLYAKWVAFVSFDYGGATSGVTIEKLEFTYGADINLFDILPEPYKTGWSFEGWFTEGDGQGTLLGENYLGSPDVNTWQLDGDTTFYAYWVKGTDKRFLYYETNATNNINVYGVRDSSITELEIPAIIDLLSVDEITEGNFHENLTKITVPDSVQIIHTDAFKGCKLTEITLPFVGKNRTTIDSPDGVFGHIFGSTVRREKWTVLQYSEMYGYDYYYYIPTTLKKVTITGDVFVPVNAFLNCTMIQEIVFLGNVTGMGKGALNCANLEVLRFEGSLSAENVISTAFGSLSKNVTVIVPDEYFYDYENVFTGYNVIRKSEEQL
ncbi:MAG: InlB B-repeat-containing protein [Clostridiales bacterium]|nr:InlB B-repeat-containing protein [Clostridiales bacterium]